MRRVDQLAEQHLDEDIVPILARALNVADGWGGELIWFTDCLYDGRLHLLGIRSDRLTMVDVQGAVAATIPVAELTLDFIFDGGLRLSPTVSVADVGDQEWVSQVFSVIDALSLEGPAAARLQADDFDDNPIPHVLFQDCRYLGGHPRLPAPVDKVIVSIDAGGIAIQTKKHELFDIDWEQVQTLDVDGPAEIRHRKAQAVMQGMLTLAPPRGMTPSYLVLWTADGEVIVEIPSFQPIELRSELGPYGTFRPLAPPPPPAPHPQPPPRPPPGTATLGAQVLAAMPPPAPPTRTVRERLEALQALHTDGLITVEDYERRRSEILAEL